MSRQVCTTPSLEQAQIGNQPQLQPLTANTTGDPRSIYLFGSLKNLIQDCRWNDASTYDKGWATTTNISVIWEWTWRWEFCRGRSISTRQVISRYVFCWSSVILSLQVIVLLKLTWTRNQFFLYTPVPLTTLLSFIGDALVPTLVLTTQTPSIFPYPPCLRGPFPILEALTATALWSLSYLFRDFLYVTALFTVSFLLSY